MIFLIAPIFACVCLHVWLPATGCYPVSRRVTLYSVSKWHFLSVRCTDFMPLTFLCLEFRCLSPLMARRSDELCVGERGRWFGVLCPGRVKDLRRPGTGCRLRSARAQEVFQCMMTFDRLALYRTQLQSRGVSEFALSDPQFLARMCRTACMQSRAPQMRGSSSRLTHQRLMRDRQNRDRRAIRCRSAYALSRSLRFPVSGSPRVPLGAIGGSYLLQVII